MQLCFNLAITCQQPVSWNTTHILTNEKTYRYNEIIRFLCSEGFYLQENKERKCTKNGPLEPPFPNCTGIRIHHLCLSLDFCRIKIYKIIF